MTRQATFSGATLNGTSATTQTTSAFSVAVGDLIWFAVRWVRDTAQNIATIADTAGNTWTVAAQEAQVTQGVNRMRAYAVVATAASATDVITVTWANACAYRTIVGGVYRGTNIGKDVAVSGLVASGTSSVTSDAFTTSKADAMLVSAAQFDGTGATWGAGSGYAIVITDGSQCLAMQEQSVSSIQTSVTATMTCSSGTGSKSIIAQAITEDPTVASAGKPWLYYHQQALLGG